MAIVSQDALDEQCRSKTILRFAKDFKLAQLLERSNIRKARGVGVLTVLVQLLVVAFSGRTLGQMLRNGKFRGEKDVFYRLMNSTSANWLKFIHLLSSSLIARLKSIFSGTMGVLILDDTLHKRNRSKNVELLTRVRDHNDGRYYRGFRCLTLCFHIASAIVPVGFRLLSSVSAATRVNGMRPGLDKRSNGYKVRQYAVSNTYDMAFDMLQRVCGMARHVLFDSWFSDPVMFKTLRGMGFHGVGMLAAKKGRLYCYRGRIYNLESLYAFVRPFIHRDQGFASIGVAFKDGTPLSITFVRDTGNRRGWLAIGTTDLSLPPTQVISLYSSRWNIEVFFKTVKSCLGFAKECQSRSFDAIVCSVAVVFTRHMILTWMNFGLPLPETPGQLFIRLFDEMQEGSFPEALAIVLREMIDRFVHYDDPMDMTLREFFANLPSCFNPFRAVA